MHRFLALSEQRFAPIPCFKRLETPNLIKTKRFACQERDLAPIQSGSNRLGTRFAEIEPPLSLEKKTHVKKALADALTQRGYETLTPVQKAVTEADLHNSDLLVSAQTGSGKTVGFGLALGETLLGAQDNFGNAEAPLALIIAPTRELALQVKRELAWLYAPAGVVMASCVGGMDMRDERRALGRGAHIVVATPGRLRDHIMRGSIDLSAVRGVVLDEADEMLDLGFREDLEFILGEAPDDRRTLMFSATVPKAIATLAKSYQRDAVRVTTVAETKQHNDIKYHAMTVANHDAENAIINILRFYEAPNAIVFCNTRAMVNRVTTRLSNRNFSVVALSGELSQAERSHALQAMRDGRARVCVATDVAARGIDLPGLDLVVHAELPNNHETLLHRSGRTGRAGRKGESCLIVTAKLRRKAERILQGAKLAAEWGEAPSAEAVRQRDQERLLADQMWNDPIAAGEEEMVDRLAEKFNLKQIAAAYLRLYNQRVSAPEELSSPGESRAAKPAASFGPSKWFSINQGRNQAAEVRRLLPILCNAGEITKDDIGAIRIQNDETFVEISQQAVAGFTQALGADMKIEGGLVVSALNHVPAAAKGPKPAFKPPQKPARGRKSEAGPSKSDAPKQDRRAGKPKGVHKGQAETAHQPFSGKPDDATPQATAKPAVPSDGAQKNVVQNRGAQPKSRAKSGSKPGALNVSRRFEKPRSPLERARDDGAVVDRKARGAKPAGKPSGKPGNKTAGKNVGKSSGPYDAKRGGGPDKPKGGKNLAPSVGKPNSKKNKARRAAAHDAGQPPRRAKS